MRTIVTEINDITDVEDLGLNLGIRMSALQKIKADHPQLERQKKMVIYYWLTRRDIVREQRNELPTWEVLADAVALLNPALSDWIRHQHC